jgi:nucleoside-diphosphate kinase
MGATNPTKAAEGTIRKRFATSIEKMYHGSDGVENSRIGRGYFSMPSNGD